MKRNQMLTMTMTALMALSLTGCASASDHTATTTSAPVSADTAASTDATAAITNLASILSGTTEADTQEDSLYTDRDLAQTAELSDAAYLTVSDGETLTIQTEGVYVISGSAENCTILVEAEASDKVQIVLDGVTVTNEQSPAIYVQEADKVFVTTTDSENTLTVTGTFLADGETNPDAVIFSKEDLVLNGTGSLTIVSCYGNGITSKDDLKVTGGTYSIQSALDAIEANDSISICGGDFTIEAGKDGLHCENDAGEGEIQIGDGKFTITAASDGIQATTTLTIDGGEYAITASEGLEATQITVNDGTLSISASDDGINATYKCNTLSPCITFNGGDVTIVMGQGDTDAIDANGSIAVNGGTLNITAPTSSFDYDQTAEFNGGTIIINGQEVSEIPTQMMGGGFGGQRGGNFGGRGRMNF